MCRARVIFINPLLLRRNYFRDKRKVPFYGCNPRKDMQPKATYTYFLYGFVTNYNLTLVSKYRPTNSRRPVP